MVTVGGTVATTGSSEAKFTVTPPGGPGADRVKVSRICLRVLPVLDV
jgi:hypothetical protein